MGGQLDNVKQSNEELEKARELTKQRNKNMCMCTLFAIALATVLGLSMYFMFFSK